MSPDGDKKGGYLVGDLARRLAALTEPGASTTEPDRAAPASALAPEERTLAPDTLQVLLGDPLEPQTGKGRAGRRSTRRRTPGT